MATEAGMTVSQTLSLALRAMARRSVSQTRYINQLAEQREAYAAELQRVRVIRRAARELIQVVDREGHVYENAECYERLWTAVDAVTPVESPAER